MLECSHETCKPRKKPIQGEKIGMDTIGLIFCHQCQQVRERLKSMQAEQQKCQHGIIFSQQEINRSPEKRTVAFVTLPEIHYCWLEKIKDPSAFPPKFENKEVPIKFEKIGFLVCMPT